MDQTSNKCEKCKRPGEPLHTCPALEELAGDTETLCNCCEHCQQNCAEDI